MFNRLIIAKGKKEVEVRLSDHKKNRGRSKSKGKFKNKIVYEFCNNERHVKRIVQTKERMK